MEEKRYYTAYDSRVKLITNIVIFGALIIFGVNVLGLNGNFEISLSILFLLFPLIILTWGIHPQYYSITNSSIRVKRPFGILEFPFKTIDSVRPIQAMDLGFSIRLFASGGLFGYLGFYSSNKIGRFVMWCTNKQDLILIICGEKKIIISPSDAEDFYNEYISKS